MTPFKSIKSDLLWEFVKGDSDPVLLAIDELMARGYPKEAIEKAEMEADAEILKVLCA